MANCVAFLAWHLKKEQLELLLSDVAGSNYSALEFKFCIDPNAETKYYMSLVTVNPEVTDNVCTNAVVPASREVQPCPVPPDCDRNQEQFLTALRGYYLEDVITPSIGREEVLNALQ